MLSFYDVTTKKYIYYDTKSGSKIYSDTELPVSKRTKVAVEPVLVKQEEKKLVLKLTNEDFCNSHIRHSLILSDDYPSVRIFTDIFYSNLYQDIEYFKRATYICANDWDYKYFSETLKLNTKRSLAEEFCERCIVINPDVVLDKDINIIYTVPPKIRVENLLTALCCNYNTLFVHANSAGEIELPMDTSKIDSTTVYRENLLLNSEDAFKLIFWMLNINNFNITVSLYETVYVNFKSLNSYCNIPVALVSNEEKRLDEIISVSGVTLFRSVE